MSSQVFIRDRERGKLGQHYAAEMYRHWGWTVYEAEDGYFTPYDLQVFPDPNDSTISRKVEVKTDFKSLKSGSLFLELEALFHSRADLLLFIEATEKPFKAHYLYTVPLQPVLSFIHTWPVKVKGGEYQEEGALVPRQVFIDKLVPQILTTRQ
jgi:hypothetical protein